MLCNKKRPRTIFDIFRYYKCYDCKILKSDETFVIGTNAIYIYYINGCGAIDIDDDLVHINVKLKLLLRDFCYYQENNIFLWFDSIDSIDQYELDFSLLFSFFNSLHIICW
jgi:hypothetical protein